MTVQAILEHLLFVLVGRICQMDIEVDYTEGRKVVICRAIAMYGDDGPAAALACGEGETHEAALNGAIISLLEQDNRWLRHSDVTQEFLYLCDKRWDKVMEQPYSMNFVRKFSCSDPKEWQKTNWPA